MGCYLLKYGSEKFSWGISHNSVLALCQPYPSQLLILYMPLSSPGRNSCNTKHSGIYHLEPRKRGDQAAWTVRLKLTLAQWEWEAHLRLEAVAWGEELRALCEWGLATTTTEPRLLPFVKVAAPKVPTGLCASGSEKMGRFSEETHCLLAVAQQFLGFPMQEPGTFGWMCISCPRSLGSRKCSTPNLP